MYKAEKDRGVEDGKVYLTLVCGHKVPRTGTPGTARFWCQSCYRISLMRNGVNHKDPYCDPMSYENGVRTINGQRMWWWRGRWRPWTNRKQA